MAVKGSSTITFFPRIESTIPHEVQRHLQLIYNKLNNHALAFEHVAGQVQATSGAIVAASGAGRGGAVISGGGGGGTVTIPTIIGFVIVNGVAGNNVGPMLVAPHSGSVSKCVVITKASDVSVALTFRIKQNGADVFSTDPTVAAGTASGTVNTFSALTSSPLNVTAGDVFQIDILTGTASWQFTAQLE